MHNHALAKMRGGGLGIGVAIRQWRTTDIGRLLAPLGVDWVNIDMEHGTVDLDLAAQMAIACQDAGVTPLVRVPGYEHHHASRVLDGGAMGIIFPHVDTAEMARRLVSYCKYPPVGRRSLVGRMVHFNYRNVPQAEAAAIANGQILVAMMIESPEGVANADAIAAVEGVDVLTVGPGDFAAELGRPGDFDNPAFIGGVETVIAACKRHGKIAGCGLGPKRDIVARFINAGTRYIQGGSDLNFMIDGAKSLVGDLRIVEADAKGR